MPPTSGVYSALAVCVLLLHTLFIVWVVFGAFVTRSRPILRWLHIASLVWGILTELMPWPCPLTVLELARSQGRCRTLPGRVSASLSGQACLSRHLRKRSDGWRRPRLRSQSCALRAADVGRSQSLVPNTSLLSCLAKRNQSHCPSGVNEMGSLFDRQEVRSRRSLLECFCRMDPERIGVSRLFASCSPARL